MWFFILSTAIQITRAKFLRFQEESTLIDLDCPPDQESRLKQILANNPYFPSFYAFFDYHGQLQTIFQSIGRQISYKIALFLSPSITVRYRRELLTLPDGATVGLDWAYLETDSGKLENENSDSVVMILHGLSGSSTSEYIVFVVNKLLRLGFQVVVLVYRGCGGLELTSPLPYIGSNVTDFGYALEQLQIRFNSFGKNKLFFALGFSLGAALTLKYIGTEKEKCLLKAAAAVSPPWHPSHPTSVFHWWSPLLTLDLKAYRTRHDKVISQHPLCKPLETFQSSKTLREFEGHMISMFGYESVEDYYDDLSPANHAHGIYTHTLAISAKDDPVCCISACPSISSKHPPSSLHTPVGPGLSVLKTPLGGHLGFPTGWFLSSESWVDDVIISWLQSHRLEALAQGSLS